MCIYCVVFSSPPPTLCDMRVIVHVLISNNSFRELLFTEDGDLKELGEVLHMPKFARTLERIRNDPEDFYYGDLAKDVVKDIQDGGGIITLEDLKNYTVKFRRPLNGTMGEYAWYSTPPPGSGVVLSFILNILKGETRNYRILSH